MKPAASPMRKAPSRPSETSPGEPDATLYYSDTSVLCLWRYPLKRSSSGRWEGVFISFVSLEGNTYSYYTDRTDWQRLSWPLKVESNDPWGE